MMNNAVVEQHPQMDLFAVREVEAESLGAKYPDASYRCEYGN